MNISFYLDDTLYTGTATPIEKEKETQFAVALDGIPHFTICPDADYGWKTDDIVSRDLVRAAGNEIENNDDVSENINVSPGKYYSSAVTGGQEPKFENGEITNEPDDVDEQSFKAETL